MEMLIKPGLAEKNYWRDLWRYRELFYFLALRDMLIRYKQTVFGLAWAILRPLLTTVVFTVVFGKIANMSAPGGVPYPLFVLAAMLPWQFFSTAMSDASNSLINNANLISKVYFPRLVVPASAVITSFVDFLITLVLLGVAMVWYGFYPDWRICCLPLFMLLVFGASLGVGLWLCALNLEYRDFRYIVPFISQFGLFISPVGFQSDSVPAVWHWRGMDLPARMIFALNPIVGVIQGFRWCLLQGHTTLMPFAVATSVVTVLTLMASGLWYFRRMERSFADII